MDNKLFYIEKPHIDFGYRAHPNMTVCMCTKSLCQIHNETFNIYTHFIPAIYIIVQIGMLLS